MGPFHLLLAAEATELPHIAGHKWAQGENSKAEGHPQNLSPSHSDLFWGKKPSSYPTCRISQAMDGHALQSVPQAGEGTVGMLPQR